MPDPIRVVIAGGGVAGLEALLALRALAGERVELTLVCPQEHFVYRPLAVAHPFARGMPRRTPLIEATNDVGATFVQASLEQVDTVARVATLGNGQRLPYDALVLALGAASEPALAHGLTWDDRSDVEALGGVLRDLEEGYSTKLTIVIPPGPAWPLPAYELALLIADQVDSMGMSPDITLVTPEQAPLAIFGSRAVEAIEQELTGAGIRVETGAYAEYAPGRKDLLLLRPSDRTLEVRFVIALPRLRGRSVDGIPADADGFVAVDAHGRVVGVDHVWAAGDGIAFPVKFGGLAAQQADAAAADIAADAGANVKRTPFRPVLRGRLLTGSGARYLRHDAAGGSGPGEMSTGALWWPPGKVAGRWLAPWLAARDEDMALGRLPKAGGLEVMTDLYRNVYAS